MEIGKQALFEKLAAGHGAGVTVVTPNTRLAQALVAQFDSFQANQERRSWEAPDILPFAAFVERLYEEALYSLPGDGGASQLPALLTPAQEQWLWQEAVSNSGLLSLSDTAEQCRKAWKLLHEWRIDKGSGNEDAQAFSAWCLKYQDLAKGQVDAARLPDLVKTQVEKNGLRKPHLLVAYGFDILPPQTQEFLAAFELARCQPEPRRGAATRTSFSSRKEELERAAAWARARLEGIRALTPNSIRIGVVVPELESRRAEVRRVFTRVLQPGAHLPGAAKGPLPFNISLGMPLLRYPVAALALSILRFSRENLPFEEVSAIIRSPFIAGAESEQAARAKLDVRLRRKLEASVSLPGLIANVESVPGLRGLLERAFKCSQEKAGTASEWARHFSKLLDAAGFPGERGLDSEEFQTRAKLHEVLGELSRLERVSSTISFPAALSTLKRLMVETPFQPESRGEAPIQVLGVLESAGLAFDCLWVSGLTDEAWPLRAHANPFIPVALQKKAGIPQASPQTSLELDRRITAGWARAADEVVFSFFSKDEDRDLAPSPLIAGFPAGEVAIPAYPQLMDLVFARKQLLRSEDAKAPPVREKAVRGGTRVLADQAACPFRAFAHWRLAAQAMETPSEGLDASDRGRLLHELMASLWGLLKSSKSLASDTGPAIERAAATAVDELGLEGRFAELERARLARLAREWLEVEKARADFEVLALEKPVSFVVSGIGYEGRIDRLDRLADGGHVLIDYKTSRNLSPTQWRPPRPQDPQLPLYAVSAKEDIAAVAFAKVRPGDMRFIGFAKEKDLLKGVKEKDWPALLREWQAETEALGKGFASGDALVDPKRGLAVTCRYCDLHTLCRVYEKVNVLAEDEPESEEGE